MEEEEGKKKKNLLFLFDDFEEWVMHRTDYNWTYIINIWTQPTPVLAAIITPTPTASNLPSTILNKKKA